MARTRVHGYDRGAPAPRNKDARLNSPAKPPPSQEVEVDLRAIHEAKGRLLSESTLGQVAVTTWVDATESGANVAVKTLERDGERKYLSDSHPGRLLALLPVGHLTGVTRREAAVLRDSLLSQQSQWPGLPVDPVASLYCVDAHPDGLPKQLYSADRGIVDWSEFRSVASGLLGIIGANRSLPATLARRTDAIARILYELFRNTHDHARTSASHELLARSVRGVHARYYNVDQLRAQLPESQQDFDAIKPDPAQVYAWAVLRSSIPTSKFQSPAAIDGLLELSIFDLGPGLAARWMGADTSHLPIPAELDAVLNCLTKGGSTTDRFARGFGLWNVLQELRALRGFIRIRTGRIHGYREFESKRDAALKDRGQLVGTPKEVLNDWNRPLLTAPSEYPKVTGTLISVLLPMRNE